MKTLGIIIFGVIFINVSVVAYFILSERESNNFENYQSVIESGLIQRGWVPEFIPESSYNINEHHTVDDPSIYVELNFKPKDISYFKKACSLLTNNTYKCSNSGYPVKVTVTNESHAVIESI